MKMPDKTLKKAKRNFILSLALLAGGIVYTVSPVDIIPDMLVPLGWVDDLGVLLVTCLHSARSYFRLKRQSGENGQGE